MHFGRQKCSPYLEKGEHFPRDRKQKLERRVGAKQSVDFRLKEALLAIVSSSNFPYVAVCQPLKMGSASDAIF